MRLGCRPKSHFYRLVYYDATLKAQFKGGAAEYEAIRAVIRAIDPAGWETHHVLPQADGVIDEGIVSDVADSCVQDFLSNFRILIQVYSVSQF